MSDSKEKLANLTCTRYLCILQLFLEYHVDRTYHANANCADIEGDGSLRRVIPLSVAEMLVKSNGLVSLIWRKDWWTLRNRWEVGELRSSERQGCTMIRGQGGSLGPRERGNGAKSRG